MAFQTDKAPEEYVELARLAERGGFDTVSVYHDLFFQPAIHALLLMAGATERVRLGPSALNPYTLHPVEIAGQIAALDAVSDGRAYLGLVRGTWLEEIGVEPERPLARIRDAVEVVRRLLACDRSGFAGEVFSLAPGAGLRYEPLRAEVPLLIGTWAPRLAAYAGTAVDEVKVGGSANPDIVPVMRERIRNDRVGIVVGAVCVVDEDGAAARRRARAEAALYFGTVAVLDPTLAVPKSLITKVDRLVRAGNADAAGAAIPDDILDRLAFAGTPEQIVRQVEALFDAGASRVELGTPHGLTDRSGVELLARRVVPAFRSAGAV
ncbi:MAG: LLM class flavin-dependent oxidoreductase [Actinomycetota bacterium]|nr:LLM class flavin-dependent oxidoreductase [Actinomycetota bacterium]